MKTILKNIVLASILLAPATELSAQLNVILKPANPYRFQVEDTWNINVLSPIDAEVTISASIQKKGMGNVLSLVSNNVVLKTGMNSFSKMLLSASVVEFFNPDIRTWYDANQALPSGNYSICYMVRCVEPSCGGGGTLGSDQSFCFNFSVENPTPLLLNSPADRAIIEDVTPLLTWIPPSPVSSQVTYLLRLVKIQEGQGKQDAISRNIPILETGGIQNVILQYPMDMPPLVKGEKYAWEVYAELFGEKIARSEVWEFEIGKDTIKKKEDPFNYIKIRQVNPGSMVTVENMLRLDYHETLEKETELFLEILSAEGKVKGTVTQPIVYGENLLNIPLSGMGLKPGEIYTVRITNKKREKYEIRIRYQFSY